MKELFARADGVDAASLRSLHIILDALPVALSWAGLPGGEIKFINRAFTRLFGLRRETLSHSRSMDIRGLRHLS